MAGAAEEFLLTRKPTRVTGADRLTSMEKFELLSGVCLTIADKALNDMLAAVDAFDVKPHEVAGWTPRQREAIHPWLWRRFDEMVLDAEAERKRPFSSGEEGSARKKPRNN
jgi:hypothetical protein